MTGLFFTLLYACFAASPGGLGGVLVQQEEIYCWIGDGRRGEKENNPSSF